MNSLDLYVKLKNSLFDTLCHISIDYKFLDLFNKCVMKKKQGKEKMKEIFFFINLIRDKAFKRHT